MAPQAGFEPATLRLTEATPKIDHVRRMMMKMMKISNLRVASDPASIAIAHFVNDGKIASFSEGYVTINVTPQPLSNISRCQWRAHSGIWLLDRERSSASASDGRCSSRNATNSSRNASTSASKVSCTALPGEENRKDYCYVQNENTILMLRKLQSLTREPRGGRGPQWQGVLRYSQFMFSPVGLDPSRR